MSAGVARAEANAAKLLARPTDMETALADDDKRRSSAR